MNQKVNGQNLVSTIWNTRRLLLGEALKSKCSVPLGRTIVYNGSKLLPSDYYVERSGYK